MTDTPQSPHRDGLLERLERGPVICGEGYLFELERRGYLQAGPFVPEAVLDHPVVVRQLHRDLVHAGSDVVEALTYYAHREKMRRVGKEGRLEELNREALRLAREVARESGALLAGNICNTNVYDPADSASHRAVRRMFEEQVGWAVEGGADFVIGETFSWCGEALIALDAIRETGLPAVVTLSMRRQGTSREGTPPEACCRQLEEAGAAVVGLNCTRGPATLLPIVRRIRGAVSCPVAALPVPYRTTQASPTFFDLRDPQDGGVPEGRPFPVALDPFTCHRYEMAAFAREAHALGVGYIGGCCGIGPHHLRSMAEALGRAPPASRYSPDMSRHAFLGGDGV